MNIMETLDGLTIEQLETLKPSYFQLAIELKIKELKEKEYDRERQLAFDEMEREDVEGIMLHDMSENAYDYSAYMDTIGCYDFGKTDFLSPEFELEHIEKMKMFENRMKYFEQLKENFNTMSSNLENEKQNGVENNGMKAFLFRKVDKSEWEYNGKIVTELPDLIIFAEDDSMAWWVLDKYHPDCYAYTLVGDMSNVSQQMIITVVNPIVLDIPEK